MQEKILPSLDYANKLFLTYDIEAFMRAPTDSENCASVHLLGSIAITANFSQEKR